MYGKFDYDRGGRPRVVQQGVWDQIGNEIILKKTIDDRKGGRWLIEGDVMEAYGFPATYVRVRRGGTPKLSSSSPVGGRWESPEEILESGPITVM
jgi:hypothetical protein